jgi:glycosyltransferase involved in cell wall biosynthesis
VQEKWIEKAIRLMINIIIPAYNSHKTIEKTIASIAVQTISDQIEIILVDDGSDYGYEEIIKKFQNLIKIKYIKHKVNLGVGFARQTGLDAVDQSYFGFADSDDFYTDAFAFEEMLNKIKKTKNAMI